MPAADQASALADYYAQHVTLLGAEGHADADVVGSGVDTEIGHDA